MTSFPSVVQHYVDLLYGAYKSSNPHQYLREFLEPYADTLDTRHVRYLHKLIYDRKRMSSKDEVMRYVEQEEQGGSSHGGSVLGRFLFFATALCHVWYRECSTAYVYPLCPERSTLIFYKECNVPVPYVWLDVCVERGQLQLVRTNVTHMQILSLTVLWKWIMPGGAGGEEPVTRQHCSYDLCTGACYDNLGAGPTTTAGRQEGLILRVAVSGEEGRVGLGCETGVQHEWPFVLLFTHSALDKRYVLSKLLYNSPTGHVLPLLCALHPLPDA